MTSSPLVFAHRGSSAALPEHTLAAYLRALDEGADGLECDVRLTRDGHLVCVHDRRLERTSNGRGRVSARTLAELDALDFGSWHPGPRRAGRRDRRAARPRPRPPAHPRPAARRGPRRRPPGPAADRDQTPVAGTAPSVERRLVELLRRHGLADPAPGRPGTGDRDVVLAAGAAPGARAGARAADRASAGGAAARRAAAAGCRSAPGSPARASAWSAPGPRWSRRCRRPATRCTSGRSTSRTTSTWSCATASTASSPTARATCSTDLGTVRSGPGDCRTRDRRQGRLSRMAERLDYMPDASTTPAHRRASVIDWINAGEAGLPALNHLLRGGAGRRSARWACRSPSTARAAAGSSPPPAQCGWALGRPVDRDHPAIAGCWPARAAGTCRCGCLDGDARRPAARAAACSRMLGARAEVGGLVVGSLQAYFAEPTARPAPRSTPSWRTWPPAPPTCTATRPACPCTATARWSPRSPTAWRSSTATAPSGCGTRPPSGSPACRAAEVLGQPAAVPDAAGRAGARPPAAGRHAG